MYLARLAWRAEHRHRVSVLVWSARYSHHSASAKLFADAEAEEREEAQRRSKPSQADIIKNQHENWDGDERIQDTVLRMLVDKYKPLRTGQIQTADEKLKASVPEISTNRQTTDIESRTTRQDTLIDPDSVKQAQQDAGPLPPWLVTFRIPSHAQASIKFGNFVSSPPRPVTPFSGDPIQSTKSRAERKAEKRFAEGAGRLDRARDLTLDYRIGMRGEGGGGVRRPNPVSLRGWNNLIEERIQRAQAMGAFDKLEGRGKPFRRTAEEMNPFVAREEFLMNRIVRKNDAAPPWVELQKDAERATVQMRELLLSGWIRRVLRILSLSQSTAALERLTPEEATKLRDSEWERQEERFHDAAIREVNDAIRRYNTVAPYVVRRPLLARQAELDRCYADAGELIVLGIRERLVGETSGGPSEDQGRSVGPPAHIGWGLRELLRSAARRLYTRLSNVVGRRMY